MTTSAISTVASPAAAAASSPAAATTSTSSTQDALTLLASDSSLAGELSPVGAAMAGALDSGLGLALGLGQDLSKAGVDAITNLAGSLTGDLAGVFGASLGTIVSGVASSVPVLGAVIGILSSVFGQNFAAEEQAACQAVWQVFTPRGSGSSFGGGGSNVLPADLFAPEHATCLPPSGVLEGTHNLMPFGPLLYRSTEGMAWMQLLLGSIVYAEDLPWDAIRDAVMPTLSAAEQATLIKRAGLGPAAAGGRALWSAFDASVERDAEIAPRQYAILNPHARPVGLPPAWRKRFRVLLRAIEELHRSPFTTATVPLGPDGNPGSCVSFTPQLPRARKGPSDGGVALWMIVADLVAAAFDHGYLTWDYALFLFTRQLGSTGSPEYNAGAVWWSVGSPPIYYNPDPVAWWTQWLLGTPSDADLLNCSNSPLLSVGTATPPTQLWGIDTCPSLIVHQLQQQVTQWRLSTHPQYEQGQEAAADLEASARAAARKATQRAAVSAAGSPSAGGAHRVGEQPDNGPTFVEVGVGLGLVVGLIAWLRHHRSPPQLGAGRYGRRWP